MGRLRAILFVLLLVATTGASAGRADRWAGAIAEASTRFQIPERWIRRVMIAESGGRTHIAGRPVVSRAGAMGLMQLMPGTWRAMRRRLRLGSDPFDPRDNILAGAFYLRLMYDRFGYPGLFAAYNAGPARYALYLSGRRALPAETLAYLDSVTGKAWARQLPPDRPPVPIFAIDASAGPDRAPALPRPSSSGLFVTLAAERPWALAGGKAAGGEAKDVKEVEPWPRSGIGRASKRRDARSSSASAADGARMAACAVARPMTTARPR